MYKNILTIQTKEFNKEYKAANKAHPGWPIAKKQDSAFGRMLQNRGCSFSLPLENESFFKTPIKADGIKNLQYRLEVYAVMKDIMQGVCRFYIKDDTLLGFFKNTEVREKEVRSLLNTDFFDPLNEGSVMVAGLIGQSFSCTIICKTFIREGSPKHLVSVLTDEMNYLFIIEDFNVGQAEYKWVFNTVINFFFYINAFPECVVDGVPSGVKRDNNAKTLSSSEKVVSHTTVEHGFVRPHFRSGYFRHYNSDFYVNCKGQVRFITSTIVKGKAKTVLSKEDV
jgi:hypothetical protein